MKTAIILISEAGLSIAQSLLNELPDSEIFTLRHEEGCTHIESAGKFTAENFNRYDAFVFIGAMGICVRTIAPCVKNKYTDLPWFAWTVPVNLPSPYFPDTSEEPTN